MVWYCQMCHVQEIHLTTVQSSASSTGLKALHSPTQLMFLHITHKQASSENYRNMTQPQQICFCNLNQSATRWECEECIIPLEILYWLSWSLHCSLIDSFRRNQEYFHCSPSISVVTWLHQCLCVKHDITAWHWLVRRRMMAVIGQTTSL